MRLQKKVIRGISRDCLEKAAAKEEHIHAETDPKKGGEGESPENM